jgi:hypothetical protein
MDPSSGGDSLPIMLQAESLNQLTTLHKALKDMQTLSLTGYGANLLGKAVSGVDETNNSVSGTVKALRMDAGGPLLELDNGKRLRVAHLTGVNET